METPNKSLNDELLKIFSYEYLSNEPCIVLSMNTDLWLPIDFICNLENIKVLHVSENEVISAAMELGAEYDSKSHLLRKRFEIARKDLHVKDFENKEEILVALENFAYISIEPEDKNVYKIYCFTEKDAEDILFHLRSLKKTA